MKQQVIPIIGGLELVTDKLSVHPGTAQYCLNYEVGQQRGIRRIDGFSRWDGRDNLANSLRLISVSTLGYVTPLTGWTLGATETITWSDGIGTVRTVSAMVVSNPQEINIGTGAVTESAWLLPLGRTENLTAESQITAVTGASEPISAARTQFLTEDTHMALAYSSYAALISALPGNSLTRIPGLHFFNDKLYAVVDLTAIEVTPIEGTMLEGAEVYCSRQSAAIGTIALTRPAATAGNTIIELFDYAPAVLIGDLYTQAASGNLVNNGTFASDTIWTKGTNWTIAAGVATAATATSALTSTLVAIPGYAYEVTYTVTAYTSGFITMSFGGSSTARSAAGTYTETIVASSAAALVFTGAAFVGSIDNVTAKVVASNIAAGGDFSSDVEWTPGAGWSIGSGVAAATTASSALTNTRAAVSGRRYRVVYTITRSAGTLTPSIGGVSGTARSAAGTYVDFITATGTGFLLFTGSGFTGTLDNVAVYVANGAATYVDIAEPQRAALYSADWDSAGGWTRIDLGRVVAYDENPASDPTAFFLPYLPSGFVSQLDANELLDTGWIGADGIGTSLGGGLGWTSAAQLDLQTNDGTTVASDAASATWWTKLLVATFSADVLNIPAGAIVRGVEVSIYRFASHTSAVSDRTITIGKTGGAVGGNRAIPGTFVGLTPATEATYGSSSDLWQLALNPNDINDGGFQVQIAYDILGGTPAPNVLVDQVRIKVHYQAQSRKAYVYSATSIPTDQEIDVIHYTVAEGTSSGSGGNGDRKGLLVLNPAKTTTDALKPWQFAPGMQVRTQSGGAGSILAALAGDDEPITLPSSYAVASENARYQFSDARPYARDDADVFFICSGTEYASMFADGYALPIQTGLLRQFEKPRHAQWSGNYLALGYATGTLSLSDTGDPLTYLSAASTAAEIGASDRVTGLARLKGDSLGVMTERTIFALQGSDSTTFQRVDISPSSGAIEYTVTDGPTGSPMFCDFRGLATIETTDRYGDFDRPGVGESASPWLIERLQSDRRNQTVDKTVVAAYPMRNKRQYRTLFADGWQSTLTVQSDGANIITTQRLYGDWQDRDTSAIRVLGLTTGVTSTGQDVAFMSFDLDPESSRYRYVFQIDAGRSFDGEEIIAQWMGQPLILGAPFSTKSLSQLGLYGRAFGYAGLKVFTASDFTDPVSDEAIGTSATGVSTSFGTAASSTEGNFKTMATIRGQGEDFTFLIESITATELPHTIQAMVVRFDSEDAKR